MSKILKYNTFFGSLVICIINSFLSIINSYLLVRPYEVACKGVYNFFALKIVKTNQRAYQRRGKSLRSRIESTIFNSWVSFDEFNSFKCYGFKNENFKFEL